MCKNLYIVLNNSVVHGYYLSEKKADKAMKYLIKKGEQFVTMDTETIS